jgi:putative ABC transport system ATP-binding protein
MVAFARALAPAPEIILMDEPTEHLDPMTADIVLAFIKGDNVLKGKTILVTTHQRRVSQRAGRVIHLKKRLH